MGLDATVYCNCYETGKLLTPPPNPELVYIRPDGDLDCHDPASFVPAWGEISQEMNDFDNWWGCVHEHRWLVHHRIGNLSTVIDLRKELNHKADSCPIILGQVLYSAFHFGDWLDLDTVRALQSELVWLAEFQPRDPAMNDRIRYFHQQMSELVEASLLVQKPIVF